MLAGCSPVVETDQARLCRMALPALMPQEARIAILKQEPDADGRGLRMAFTAEAPGGEPQNHLAACRFRMPGRPRESRDLTSLTLDGQALSETQLFFLIRYWLATPEGRAADPAPLGDLSALPVVPHAVAYGLQMALDGLPLASIYALLAAAYSLIYGLIGRINFAFGEIAAAGGYAAAIAALAMLGWPPAPLADRGLRACGRGRLRLGVRFGARGVHSAAQGSGSAGAGGDRGPGDFLARAPASRAGRSIELDEPAAQPAVRARACGRLCGRRHADGVCRQRRHARRRSRASLSSSAIAASGANGAPMPTIRSPPR